MPQRSSKARLRPALCCLGLLALIAGFAWPSRQPKAIAATGKTIFIAGDFDGNLAPCGCSSPMLGGIQRLGSALNTVPPNQRIFLVNGGLLPATAPKTIPEVRQREMKVETLAEAFGSLKAGAINLDQEEASTPGALDALRRLSNSKLTTSSLSHSPFPTSLEAGPFNVFGLTDQEDILGAITGLSPVRLSDAVQKIQEGSTRRTIILWRGGESGARQLASELPSSELIVYSSSGTPPEPEKVGITWLVSPGSGGRAVIRIQDDGIRLGRPDVITLTPEFPDAAQVRTYYRDYLRRIEKANLLKDWPRTPFKPTTWSKTGTYAGPEACTSCHKAETHSWLASAHAHAYPDLVVKGHGRDPDCVVCHVTGLSSTKGFQSLALTAKLANVTCESCHGPSADHVKNPHLYRLPVLSLQMCVSCHTSDNSPGFDPQRYWAKIAHGHTIPAP